MKILSSHTIKEELNFGKIVTVVKLVRIILEMFCWLLFKVMVPSIPLASIPLMVTCVTTPSLVHLSAPFVFLEMIAVPC